MPPLSSLCCKQFSQVLGSWAFSSICRKENLTFSVIYCLNTDKVKSVLFYFYLGVCLNIHMFKAFQGTYCMSNTVHISGG